MAEQLGTNKWAPTTNGGGLKEGIEGQGEGKLWLVSKLNEKKRFFFKKNGVPQHEREIFEGQQEWGGKTQEGNEGNEYG